MEQTASESLLGNGIVGLIAFAIGTFLWQGLWPWFKTEYWPYRVRMTERRETILEEIRREVREYNAKVDQISTIANLNARRLDDLNALAKQFAIPPAAGALPVPTTSGLPITGPLPTLPSTATSTLPAVQP